MVQAVEFAFSMAAAHAVLGFVVAHALHLGGLRRIDPTTQGAGFFFRALITPGVVALWPILLHKWGRLRAGHNPLGEPERPIRPSSPRKIHGLAFKLLALILPILFATGILARSGMAHQGQGWPEALTESGTRTAVEGTNWNLTGISPETDSN